ncbi:MAG: PD-(D/E)XK nuclease family protein [Deltaproteobacteria bacterium]|nr:PD-(D/E)XK nuclease family protein [Deltaproteobacteria bacterium]
MDSLFQQLLQAAPSLGGHGPTVTVVTATRRLSRVLRRGYGAWRLARGDTVWPEPDILPWEAWARRAWEEGWEVQVSRGLDGGQPFQPPPRLFTPLQEELVWAGIIAQQQPPPANVPGTAKLAGQAWKTLADWGLAEGWAAQSSGLWPYEAKAFQQWCRAFGQVCRRQGWAVGGDVLPRLIEWLAEPTPSLTVPRTLVAAGFDQPTPMQERLFQALAQAGARVERWQPPLAQGTPQRLALPTAALELAAAARWAAERLRQNPQARVGVVVAGLGERRALAERLFLDTLQPEGLLDPIAPRQRLVNVADPPPLDQQPLAAAALGWLERLSQPVWEAKGGYVRSPFLGGAEEEQAARALLDEWLVREWACTPGWLARAARGFPGEERKERDLPPAACPRLAGLLEGFQREAQTLRGQRMSPPEWARAFGRVWQSLGLPGERPLDSEEFQTWNKLQDTLGTLAGLEVVAPRWNLREALEMLGRILQDTPFQPQSADAPVEMLGMLEAGGLSFDHLWVAGLHHAAWPPPPRPNPYLLGTPAIAAGVPHGTPERELAFAQRELDRLLASAPEVVVSYPRTQDQEALSPSPLIAHLPVMLETMVPKTMAAAWKGAGGLWAPWLGAMADHPAVEPHPAGEAPPLAEGDTVAGGQGVLADMAACPFRAFVHHRLGVWAASRPGPGLTPLDQGSLLHGTLEEIWKILGTQAALKTLPTQARRELAESCARRVVEQMARWNQALEKPLAQSLEINRLAGLAVEWLALEEQRTPFRVQALEQKMESTLGGLTLNLRVDRSDEVEGLGRVMLDYKSGKASAGSWLPPRPDAPQLPLYLLVEQQAGTPVAGIGFANLKPGEMGWSGLYDAMTNADGNTDVVPPAPGWDPVPSPSKKEQPFAQSWGQALGGWRAELERLAQDFRRGQAPVDPKKGSHTCQYCGLDPLCRRHSLVEMEAEEDRDEDGEENSGEGLEGEGAR